MPSSLMAGIDQSDPTNLYLGVVLILVVVLSGEW